MRPITTVIGPSAAPGATSPMVNTDAWADAPLGVQVAVSGTANFTIQHSFDDPNDLVSPVPLANMFWDTGLVPAGAIAASAGVTFSMATAPTWLRVLLNSGAGTVRLTITQFNVVES